MTDNIDTMMAAAESQNFDMLGAVEAVYTFSDGSTANIKVLADYGGIDSSHDGMGEIEIANAEFVILKDTEKFGVAAPKIGEKITIGTKVWLIVSKIAETSFDITVSVRYDEPKNKQYESRFKRLK